jgi:hypothetical protein
MRSKKEGLPCLCFCCCCCVVVGAHFWWGQFEHSSTLRPVPRVQRLARTSASLTLLPHWQVLVFGAAGCSSAWAWGSSRCLFWPMVGDEGVGVVIVVAFLCVWLSLSRTITHTNHFNFPISQWSRKIHCVTASQANLAEALSQLRTDNLFTRMAPKPLRICRRLGDNGGRSPL